MRKASLYVKPRDDGSTMEFSVSEMDDKKRDEVLKRMLSTPPKPHDVKAPLTKEAPTKKGDDEVKTRRRPDPKRVTSSES